MQHGESGGVGQTPMSSSDEHNPDTTGASDLPASVDGAKDKTNAELSEVDVQQGGSQDAAADDLAEGHLGILHSIMCY